MTCAHFAQACCENSLVVHGRYRRSPLERRETSPPIQKRTVLPESRGVAYGLQITVGKSEETTRGGSSRTKAPITFLTAYNTGNEKIKRRLRIVATPHGKGGLGSGSL
jgi:hypothetical protein